jgi:hypothetical protein
MSHTVAPAPVWKRVAASILDLVTVFVAAGWLIGYMTGSLTSGGFSLTGWPALILFATIVAYFLIFRRLLGGTLWDRILRIGRPQPY